MKVGITIGELCIEAYANSKAHGFHDGDFNVPEKLALIHSEVSEALECYREREMETVVGVTATGNKPLGFLSELADVMIRCGDLIGRLGRIEEFERVLAEKMAYNKTRPHKHGKVC